MYFSWIIKKCKLISFYTLVRTSSTSIYVVPYMWLTFSAVTIVMFNVGRRRWLSGLEARKCWRSWVWISRCCLLSTDYWVSEPQVCYNLSATETILAQLLRPRPYGIHYLTISEKGVIRPSDFDQHFVFWKCYNY